jgi:hypothetical protein
MSRTPQPTAATQAIEEIEITNAEDEDEQPEDLDVELSDDEDQQDEEEDQDGFEDDDYFDLAQLSQLLVTEEGEPLADVLKGIRDALDKHNKILFRLVGTVEKLASK